MPTVFTSRVQFTIAGAPPQSFYMDNIQSVSYTVDQINSPFVKINKQPYTSGYLNSYKVIQIEISYFTTDDEKTFNFSLIPSNTSIPIQLILYKPNNIIAIFSNIEYNGSRVISSGPNRPTILGVRFLASRIFENTYT